MSDYTTYRHKLIEPGSRFHALTVVNPLEERSAGGHRMYRVVCDCGNWLTVSSNKLKSSHTKSCGCQSRSHHRPRKEAEFDTELVTTNCGFCDQQFAYSYTTGRRREFCDACQNERRTMRRNGKLKPESRDSQPTHGRPVRTNFIAVQTEHPEPEPELAKNALGPARFTNRRDGVYVLSPNGMELELVAKTLKPGEFQTFRTATNEMVSLKVTTMPVSELKPMGSTS